ncbi:hypothetical protein [uncultured Arcobacter sp.]|uniref:hypothetical protein n=1 Tax=uncultured Arcobacter sp. TaxID=165434 RepID=UPI0026049EDB|nr:hypothetical protein [uncultured Arcobacter sp.]
MGTTLVAKQLVASSFTTGTIPTPSHVAWGDGSTAFTTNDTTLESEIERNAYTDRILESQTVEFDAVLLTSEAVGSTITETGLLDSSTGGNLFVRDTFGGIDKTNQFELETRFVIRIK